MANPYLIAAIYGPKPTVPVIKDAQYDAGSVELTTAGPPAQLPIKLETCCDEVPAASTTNIASSELIKREASYDESLVASSPKIASSEPIHPARQQLMELDESLEEQDKESVFWTPTGSNVLPLGHKLDDAATIGRRMFPMTTTTPSLTGYTSSIGQPYNLQGGLKYPPVRYLPPPGPYYDQFSLSPIFGVDFFSKGKCSTCWDKKHLSTEYLNCQRACTICGTKDHPDESCSILYCTVSWYLDRGIPTRRPTVRFRQMRPTETDIVVLRQMGLVTTSSEHGSPIIPNMFHPIAQKFYHNKPAPEMLHFKSALTKATPKSNIGRGLSTKHVEPQPAISAHVSLSSSNTVNSSLDPRLQGRVASGSGIASPAPVDTMAFYNVQAVGKNTVIGEDRLQDMEEEVLRLRTDNIVKDREIRRLRAENEQLRGIGYETGNKRPCM